MKLKDIKKVFVVGAGTMGQQIAFQCAAHGYAVILFDLSDSILRKARLRIKSYADYLIAENRLDGKMAGRALDNIAVTTEEQRASEIDLLIESVPEDLQLKREIFSRFNRICPERTVFATNTSLLIPSQMADATGRADRFLALHFHQPVWVGNLADVMPHAGTAEGVVDLVRNFARSINQISLVLQKENYGYVFNAMYSALNNAAITLAANGVAAVEDIDRAWMVVMKMPVGPLGMLDVVGLDTVWHVTDYWANTLGDAQTLRNAEYLKREYLEHGWLGVKSGRGFYGYPRPAYQEPDFVLGGNR
ncbi:MAG: 3-hydroxyacyl-CoA dehydrogenase [Syntrophotalea acetylenica]|uniref:3-hydroxyacyl-CoA dehydrogenase n=1 Tax=Syntrophotalea acetylenica TaxID=29542 RepID=UPI002A35F813|nr:3-hydroxyacyl-CoA dehydrogenase [Syntrophotalea acetylenica]MDD4457091.1 3-hydroxyacyl-CoA dehydrogenase [Syntrophotalea acetylenica]MDY0261086.1 3-hydroxyacyl-CoA dehydrogenase [Syntrophotalea acetylenica]